MPAAFPPSMPRKACTTPWSVMAIALWPLRRLAHGLGDICERVMSNELCEGALDAFSAALSSRWGLRQSYARRLKHDVVFVAVIAGKAFTTARASAFRRSICARKSRRFPAHEAADMHGAGVVGHVKGKRPGVLLGKLFESAANTSPGL